MIHPLFIFDIFLYFPSLPFFSIIIIMSVENIDNENNDPSIVDNDQHSLNNLLVAKNEILKGNFFLIFYLL